MISAEEGWGTFCWGTLCDLFYIYLREPVSNIDTFQLSVSVSSCMQKWVDSGGNWLNYRENKKLTAFVMLCRHIAGMGWVHFFS